MKTEHNCSASSLSRKKGVDPRILLKLPRIPGKTVYVLGAGFSYPLGVPLISDFIPRGLDLLKRPDTKNARKWTKYKTIIKKVIKLADRYRRPLGTLADRDPNLEDVFSFADLLWENDGEDHKILAEFVRDVCKHALMLHGEGLIKPDEGRGDTIVPRAHFNPESVEMPAPDGKAAGVCMYQAFISQVLGCVPETFPSALAKPEDDEGGYGSSAIINLNYDLVIEKKLKTLGLDPKKHLQEKHPRAFYGFGCVTQKIKWERSGARLPLIKLHGSINWQKPERQKPEGAELVQEVEDMQEGKDSAPPLIYPSWVRERQPGSVFDKLLTEVRIHLRLAQRIVFIGYSLPTSDRHIAYLLSDGLDTAEPPEIETANLWKTDEEARGHVKAMMGERAARQLKRNHPEGLKGFVKFWTHSSSVLTDK